MVDRPVSTYSIVAIDRRSNQMGVAVQSHWFSVGSVVPWGEAGVGVVATQAFVEASYGPLGLKRMKAGNSPSRALRALLKADPRADVRQVAMLDANGRVAAHTGEKCLPEAGDQQGTGFSVQANLMSSREVWPAMADSFRRSRGSLAERMMVALEAAEEAGGDVRGRQSAAMLVVPTRPAKPWKNRLLDLRVEDHPTPLVELRRLLRVNEAYDHANRGDDFVAESKFDEAMTEYTLAAETAPEIEELKFWQGVTLLERGHEDEALPLLREAVRVRKEWRNVFKRLPEFGILNVGPGVLKRVAKAISEP